MKPYDTILFDLDGTLLSMDQDAFLTLYFSTLAAKMKELGYPPEILMPTTKRCVEQVVLNESTATNEEIFTDVFAEAFPEKTAVHEANFLSYYQEDFLKTRAVCSPCEDSSLIHALRQRGKRIILATSPLFPRIATEERIRWAGLSPEDFDYITTYENCTTAKPNPRYYREICEKCGVEPTRALMVGNDTREDTAATQIGMDVFLLTPYLVNRHNDSVEAYPHGSFDDLRKFLELE